MIKDLKNIYKIEDNTTIKNLKNNYHFTSSNTNIFSDFINDLSIKYFLIKSNIMLLSNNFNISIYLNILKIIFENINNPEILEKEYMFFKQINIYGIMDKLLNDFRLELLFSENELKKFSEKLKELYYDLITDTKSTENKKDEKIKKINDKLDIIINDLIKIKKIITQLDDIIKINKNISDIKFLETQKNKKEIIFDLLEKIDSFKRMTQEFKIPASFFYV
jgi:hypothetical protein